MAILVGKDTKVIIQGITGRNGSFHAKLSKEYGTKVVAGITPGKAGQNVDGIPVFDSCEDVVREFGKIDATCIFVPAKFAPDSIIEAADSGIKLIVVITEGIPTIDFIKAKEYAKSKGSIIIGPNCPGVITPEACRIGIMPGYIFKRGSVGVVSRSGTLTYEAVWQMTRLGIGQSTCVGIGGDPVVGTTFVEVLDMFEKDPETKMVVLIGEIGGTAEQEAAEFIKKMTKPVVAFVAGRTAPAGKRMGHAGAIIMGSSGRWDDKVKALSDAGATIAESPSEIGIKVKELADRRQISL
ncbi:MAG: succinate--CoA ligase subunit alpha [Candidatus Calescibacterium sp.]|nr:succinate--CoA ligase subunit alpha [Candidatus Calescibacterium sp.]MDW8088032.1 succinate--CoA ligase subunit alpha [Candidatus Calescibacterium sp.]